ncbi:MAG: protein kinase [Ignavibacteria bacterium]|nr:protein kinase [Ignavibacteria bacterium]
MIGEQVRQYRILSLIGSGGMGVVYKAEDTRLKRPVALKFLQKQLVGDAASKERFINEARAASALDHPNICTIYDIGEKEDGQLFIAMRYYEGETLRARLRRAPVPHEEARSIVLQLAGALGAAHARGIVHRDIKPDNVFLTADGVVKILDFGLAKLERLPHDSDTLSASGTVAYMAPEQLRGEDADARTDIWALGILLFEMLTQRLPFQGYIHAAMMYSILNEEPEDLARILPDVPEPLNGLYNACVRKDRAMRPRDAAEVLRRLVIERQQQAASPKRTPTRKALVGFIVVAACALAAALWFFWPKHPGFMTFKEGKIPIAVMPITIGGPYRGSDSLHFSEKMQRIFIAELNGNDELNVASQSTLNESLRKEFPDQQTMQFDEHIQDFLRDNALQCAVFLSVQPIGDSSNVHMSLIDDARKELLSMDLTVGIDKDLSFAVKTLAANLNDYFLIQAELRKDPSIKLWAERGSADIDAQNAFLHGYLEIVDGGSGEKRMREALEHDTSFVAAHVFLISALLNKDRYEDAVEQYRALRRLEAHAKGMDKVIIRYAGALIAENREEMINCLEELFKDNQGNFVLLTTLAAMKYLGKRDVTGAEYRKTLDMIRPAIAARWRNPLAYGIAAECFIRLGEKDSVYVLVRDNPPAGKDVVSLIVYAVLKKQDGAVGTAEEMVDQAKFIFEKRGFPEDERLMKIAALLLKFNDTSYAETTAQSALAVNEANAAALLFLGNIAWRRGRVLDASRNFSAALLADPKKYEAHFGLGEIYFHQGNMSAARRQYENFRKFDSKTEEADIALARIMEIRALGPQTRNGSKPRSHGR